MCLVRKQTPLKFRTIRLVESPLVFRAKFVCMAVQNSSFTRLYVIGVVSLRFVWTQSDLTIRNSNVDEIVPTETSGAFVRGNRH